MKAYLEPNDVTLIEETATNLRDRLLIRLLFHLGCRVSEALAITVDDIDMSGRTVKIQHLKTRLLAHCAQCAQRLGGNYAFCPKCGSKVGEVVRATREHRRQRVLLVDQDTLAMLKEYVARGGPVVKEGKTLIFGINRHRAWQIVKGCAERAGIPKIVNLESGKMHHVSPHRFRDAFAVMAVKNNDSGDGLRLLQEHLGHQSFNTTARYRKISSGEHRQWYDDLWSKE